MEKNVDSTYGTGKGNWHYFNLDLKIIEEVSKDWKNELSGVNNPWLCWNVDPDWCLLQQKLALHVGWTPIVGGDPRAKLPKLLKESLFIDFNKKLKLPMMHFLFPIEFCFLFVDKIAFWHSDLLVRNKKLLRISNIFNQLKDGDIAVTNPTRSIKMKLLKESDRYWELIGCTTRSASKSQYDNGSGWFSNIIYHPNCPEEERALRKNICWDHGAGIKYWSKKYKLKKNKVILIPEKLIDEGHCTRIRNKNYILKSPNNEKRDLSKDLIANYALDQECHRLGLSPFLRPDEV